MRRIKNDEKDGKKEINTYKEKLNLYSKIVKDFIKAMEGINEKRIKLSNEEHQFALNEMLAFNRLRNDLLTLENKYLSENK